MTKLEHSGEMENAAADAPLVLDTPDPRMSEIGVQSTPYRRSRQETSVLGGLSRQRLTLVGVLGAIAFFCLGGTIIGYNLYDRATKIDRTSPEVVVEKYIYAMFEERDDSKVKLFECNGKASNQGLRLLLNQVAAQEARFNIKIAISTANYRAETVGDSSTVAVDLVIDAPEDDGRLSRSAQRWQFLLRNIDGWRICSAMKSY